MLLSRTLPYTGLEDAGGGTELDEDGSPARRLDSLPGILRERREQSTATGNRPRRVVGEYDVDAVARSRLEHVEAEAMNDLTEGVGAEVEDRTHGVDGQVVVEQSEARAALQLCRDGLKSSMWALASLATTPEHRSMIGWVAKESSAHRASVRSKRACTW